MVSATATASQRISQETPSPRLPPVDGTSHGSVHWMKVACVVTAVAGLMLMLPMMILCAQGVFGAVGGFGFAAALGGSIALPLLSVVGALALGAEKTIDRKEEDILIPRRKGDEFVKEAFGVVFQQLEADKTLTPLKAYNRPGSLVNSEPKHGPVDEQIPRLAALYWKAIGAFEKILKRYPNDPYARDEVLQAADSLLKIGFVVSVRTLNDLPAFLAVLKVEKKVERTAAQALCESGSYQYRTFFYCTSAYLELLKGLHWDEGVQGFRPLEGEALAQHVSRFEGRCLRSWTTQCALPYTWRKLYNQFCKRVDKAVGPGDLKNEDPRFYRWSRKDKPFPFMPDALPT